MKIQQIIGAVLLSTLLLSACAPKQDEPLSTTTSAAQTTATDVTTTVQTQGTIDPIPTPVVGGIGEKSERFEVRHDDKTVLWVTLSLPVASITGNDTLQSTLTARLDLIEAEIRDYADVLSEKYEADIEAGKQPLATPSLQVRFALNYFTAEAASLTYFYNETTSEGRTSSYTRFCNIDLRVGSEIMLSALLTEGAEAMLVNRVKDAIAEKEISGLYEGQKELISDLLGDNWYMKRDALAFRFSPGVLAPVSSGEILVEFDKDELADLLSGYGSALIGNQS